MPVDMRRYLENRKGGREKYAFEMISSSYCAVLKRGALLLAIILSSILDSE